MKFHPIVRSLRTMVAVVLTAVWMPASSHALLQHLELIHQVHADHEPGSDGSHEHDAKNHDAADGKCTLASTHVGVPLPDAVATPVLFCALGLDRTSELHVELQPSGLAPPGTAPPQLLHTWQFASRAALPVRAPSFAS